MIEVYASNMKKYDKALEDISASIGLLQSCGIPFQVTYPIVTKGMEILNELAKLRVELQVVESGRGRQNSHKETPSEEEAMVAQLEAEMQALAPDGVETPQEV